MKIPTGRTQRLIQIATATIGVFLIWWGRTLTRSTCWGHLGCNYYWQKLSYSGYAGMVLAGLGVIAFSYGVLKQRVRKSVRIAVMTVLLLIILMIEQYLTSLTVSVW